MKPVLLLLEWLFLSPGELSPPWAGRFAGTGGAACLFVSFLGVWGVVAACRCASCPSAVSSLDRCKSQMLRGVQRINAGDEK